MKRKDFAEAQQAQLKHRLDSYEENQKRFAADAITYEAKMMELAQKYKDDRLEVLHEVIREVEEAAKGLNGKGIQP